MFTYDTVTEALTELKKRGYTYDFNLKQSQLCCDELQQEYDILQVQIQETYRFEGDTDPADEAIVHALVATDGVKGTFVDGYGIYSENETGGL